MSPNRMVATLTPLAALLAGISADWLAKNAPGVDIPASAFEEIFVAGIAAVVAPAVVWLLGWQKHEMREAELARLAEGEGSDGLELTGVGALAPPSDGFDEPPAFGDPEDSELDALNGFEDMDDLLGSDETDDLTGSDEMDDLLGFDDVDELGEHGDDELLDSPLTDRVG